MLKLFIVVVLVAAIVAVPFGQKEGNGGDVRKELQEKVDVDLGNEKKKPMTEIQQIEQKFEKEIEQLKKDNEELRQEFQNIRKERQLNSETLFLATISAGSIPISDDEVIVFDTAPINPGGHYSTVLGAYTAPYNGYYQFSVLKQGDNYSGSFFFLVDEMRYAVNWIWTDTGTTTPSSSATINIELAAGQVVRVQNDGSSNIMGINADGYMQSWFTGHLLYAL